MILSLTEIKTFNWMDNIKVNDSYDVSTTTLRTARLYIVSANKTTQSVTGPLDIVVSGSVHNHYNQKEHMM